MAAFNNKKDKSYKKPKRELAKNGIRKLIVEEGLTNRQISERLNIPQRSVERYISEIYEHDNQILASLNTDTEMLTRSNICRERMDHHRQEILANIARNPNTPFKDRMAAWHIICELEAADLRLLNNCIEMVSRRSALSHRNNHLLAKRSNIVNLRLPKKEERGEEESQYDELDAGDDDEEKYEQLKKN